MPVPCGLPVDQRALPLGTVLGGGNPPPSILQGAVPAAGLEPLTELLVAGQLPLRQPIGLWRGQAPWGWRGQRLPSGHSNLSILWLVLLHLLWGVSWSSFPCVVGGYTLDFSPVSPVETHLAWHVVPWWALALPGGLPLLGAACRSVTFTTAVFRFTCAP